MVNAWEGPKVVEHYWEEQLGSLPCKAQLAFAVRCLQQTYSFVIKGKNMPKAIVDDYSWLIKAIKMAEEEIGNKVSCEDLGTIEDTITIRTSYPPLSINTHIGNLSCRIIKLAGECCPHNKVVTRKSIAEIMLSIQILWENLFVFEFNIPDFFIALAPFEHDLNLLKQRAQDENWTDDTPFPAGFFGPLWSVGNEAGFLYEAKIEKLQMLNEELIRKLQHPNR